MRIEAATLAGGGVNQDYYAYGNTYALVLDGASSFLPEQTSIDAATYVKALGESLAAQLEYCALDKISEVVATAIEEVVKKYEFVEESSPNSTIVIAKWTQEELATYVLGDSSCLVYKQDGNVTVNTDNSMALFGEDIRDDYRKRLKSGLGFDKYHRNLLKNLQQVQLKHKNIENGYWIAGASLTAGYRGLVEKYLLESVNFIILASDGRLTSLQKFNESISDKKNLNMRKILEMQDIFEELDSNGSQYPRSKLHDDKTVVKIVFI